MLGGFLRSPSVSVIVPVYNAEKYLPQCIDSIVNQTIGDIEVLLINDGSSDSSGEILAQYASKDERIKVIEQPNKGAGAARNIGLAMAEGKYLSFLDSDDFFEPNMLELALAKASEDDADIVAFGAWLYDENRDANRQAAWVFKKGEVPSSCFSSEEAADNLFGLFGNYTWNKLFKRDFILEKKITFQEIERTNDLLFTCTALALAERISPLDRQLVHYRVTNRASLQSENDKSPLCFAYAFESLWISLCRRGVSDLFEGTFSRHFVDAIVANSNSMRTISGLREIADYTKAQIEPHFSLSEKAEVAGCDSSLLEQYRTLVFSQLEDYLLLSRRMAQYALDDQAWYLDWLEWASWKRNSEQDAEMAKMRDRLARLEGELEGILGSRSYKIGRAVTAPIRRLAGLI